MRLTLNEARRVGKGASPSRRLDGCLCAFAHAVRTRSSTAWAKSPIASPKNSYARSGRFCPPYPLFPGHAGRPIDRHARALGGAESVAARLLEAGERARDKRHLDATPGSFSQHDAQVLDAVVERKHRGAEILS